MACDCEEYICLEVISNGCDGIVLDLAADQTGTWNMLYQFNGRWFKETIDVTDGDNVEVPNVFNENYVHHIKFMNTAGELVNDTCYKLDTSLLAGYSPSSATTGSTDIAFIEYEILTSPDANNADEQPVGSVITDNRLIGYYVTSISTQGQSYNREFYTKAKTSNTLTFTAGSWTDGNIVTVYLSKNAL